MGDLTAYYAYPESTTAETKTIVITGEGVSPRDVRQNAELKVEQMDVQMVYTRNWAITKIGE